MITNRSASKTNREAGFSLLETIIALVILSLSLAALFEAYGDGLRAITAGNRHGEARLLAQSLLAEVDDKVAPGNRQGRSNGLAWRLEITPATGDLASKDAKAKWALYEVVATVRWSRGRRIKIRTLRLGPVK